MRRAISALVILGLAGLPLSAKKSEIPGASEQYAYDTFREVAGEVTMMVYTATAHGHDENPWVAFEVAVGVWKNPGISVGRESFTLIDAQGNRYPAAPWKELQDKYRHQMMSDEEYMRQMPMPVGSAFDNSTRLGVDFYPIGASPRLRSDLVEVPAFHWFASEIYFPTPPDGLDGLLTIEMKAEGMDSPVQVKFGLRLKKRNLEDSQPNPDTRKTPSPTGNQ